MLALLGALALWSGTSAAPVGAAIPREPVQLAARIETTERGLADAIDRWRAFGKPRPPLEVTLWALYEQRISIVLTARRPLAAQRGAGQARAGTALAAPPAARVQDRPRRAGRRPTPSLPRGAAALPRWLERAGGGQLHRVGVQQAPQREHRGRAGADAVHSLHVAGLRARRQRPRPARRRPRRRELPARE